MKADLRISIKKFHRNKDLKIQFSRVPFTCNRQFLFKINSELRPENGRLV